MEDAQSYRIRMQIFDWLKMQIALKGDVLTRNELQKQCVINGRIIPLMGPQGIFKPKILTYYPISITTTPKSTYADQISADNTISYSYRETDPGFHENVRLKDAMRNKIPLVYFLGIVPGRYLVQLPVFIVGADDRNLKFTVEADIMNNNLWQKVSQEKVNEPFVDELRRKYATTEMVIRLHQRAFREKVLDAYRSHCAFCSLRHRELLDAAHIIPDSEGGEPEVRNGLSLCKIHHAAFDQNILGINEDYRIEVRKDILEEIDGPMLKYGLQEMNHRKIILPRSNIQKPEMEYLRKRYEDFLRAG